MNFEHITPGTGLQKVAFSYLSQLSKIYRINILIY